MFAKLAGAGTAPAQATDAAPAADAAPAPDAAPTSTPDAQPDPKNLLEYIQNYGPLEILPPQQAAAEWTPPAYSFDGQPPTPEDGALGKQAALDEEQARQATQHDQRPVPEYWQNGQPPTPEDGALHQNPPHAPDTANPMPVQPGGRRPPPFMEPWPDRVPQVADELPALGPDGSRPPRPLAMPETHDLTKVGPEEFAEIYRNANEDCARINAERARLTQALEGLRRGQERFGRQAAKPLSETWRDGMSQSGVDTILDDVTKAALGLQLSPNPVAMVGNVAKNTAKGEVEERVIGKLLTERARAMIERLEPQLEQLQDLGKAHEEWHKTVQKEKERRQGANR